jgi:hypothetical protein
VDRGANFRRILYDEKKSDENTSNPNYFRMFHDAGPTLFVTVVNIISVLIIINDNLSSVVS